MRQEKNTIDKQNFQENKSLQEPKIKIGVFTQFEIRLSPLRRLLALLKTMYILKDKRKNAFFGIYNKDANMTL